MQNTSHAVMSQRVESRDSLDDFPTPPWAVRAFAEEVLGGKSQLALLSVLEPACGRGHMAQTLKEYFGQVAASDIFGYGYGATRDFLAGDYAGETFDWVVTNPPFRLAEEFILAALPLAKIGVAMLVRTVFTESVGRYERLFNVVRPSRVVQYTERVPMIKGRVDRKASTATGYAWVIWEHSHNGATEFYWVPPSRKRLEKREDYDDDFLGNGAELELGRQGELFVIGE